MKYFLLLIFSIIIFSCKSDYTLNSDIKIKIVEFKIPNTSIRAIKVINDSTLVYCGSNAKFGKTTNLGKTWKTISLNIDTIYPEFRSIAFNNKSVYVLSAGSPAILYKIDINTLHKKLVYKNDNPNIFFDSMIFTDSLHAIAVGDPISDCLSILETNNGGNTWTLNNCNKFPKALTGEAAFAASNTNIASINNKIWIASGGLNSRVYHYNNKNKLWTVYNTPIIKGKSSTGIFSIAFSDEKHGIIIGGDYLNKGINTKNKAITKNGGKTWKLVSNGKEPSYKSCVQYIPNSKGKKLIAVGTTGISFSNNSGKSWKKISTKSFYTIRFINKNKAWLAGPNKIGLLYFTPTISSNTIHK